PAMRELAHQQALTAGEAPDRVHFDPRRQDDPPAAEPFGHAFGADLRERRAPPAIVSRHLELDERAVRATLFLEIAVMDNRALFHDHGLVAHLLDVTEQVRADEDVHALLVLHFRD